MESGLYQKKQVAEKLAYAGITPRLVQFYTEEGIVIPDKANPSGKGSTRYYSSHNLADFLIVKKLSASGLNLESIREVMRTITKSNFRKYYFASGSKVLEVSEPNEPAPTMKVHPIYIQSPETRARAAGRQAFEYGNAFQVNPDEFSVTLHFNLNRILEKIQG
jgi:DNA-binding transcriptional MerR regulator